MELRREPRAEQKSLLFLSNTLTINLLAKSTKIGQFSEGGVYRKNSYNT
jgi:hypothetical protein